MCMSFMLTRVNEHGIDMTSYNVHVAHFDNLVFVHVLYMLKRGCVYLKSFGMVRHLRMDVLLQDCLRGGGGGVR